MGTRATVGLSQHSDGRVAGAAATAAAMKELGCERADFVVVFASIDYEQTALLRAVREAAGGAPLWGCSAAGVIAGEQTVEAEHQVSVMAIVSDELRFDVAHARGLLRDSHQVGRDVGRALCPKVQADALALFVVADGLTSNFDRFAAGLGEALALDRFLPMFGGHASEPFRLERTCQYAGDEALSDGASVLLLSGKARIAWARSHGCTPIGAERRITAAVGNVITKIDDRPSLEVFREYLTDDEIRDWSKAAVNVCLAFKPAGHDEYVVRVVQRKDDATGALVIGSEVSAGTSVWLTRRDAWMIASGIDDMVAELARQLAGRQPRLVFQFDCVGRGKLAFFEEQRQALHAVLKSHVGPRSPWLGFYSYGEIGPVRTTNCLHSYTAVIAALYED